MRLRLLRSLGSVLGFAAAAALVLPTAGVSAVPTGPTVIAVHRNGAVDIAGNSTFGTIARMAVPAGNWSVTATATLIGTTGLDRVECQLVAGTEFYKAQTLPTGQGVGSYEPMVLLLAHHFAKSGAVILKCYSNGWLGDALLRDVHVTAVRAAQLTNDSGSF